MKKVNYINLLDYLSTNNYVTSASLALSLGVSSKTVRNHLKELAVLLNNNGASLSIKPHYGIKLIINDYQKYNNFYNLEKEKILSEKQIIHYERVDYLIDLFLNNEEYVLLDQLAENLYISRNSLTTDLHKVRKYLENFQLTIINKPNYGLKLCGDETNIRCCLLDRKYNNTKLDDYNNLFKFIKNMIENDKFIYFKNCLHEIILYFLISATRINQGHFINKKIIKHYNEEELTAKQIYDFLDIPANPVELQFAGIFLKSRQSYPLKSPYLFYDTDFEIQNIIIHILEDIYKYYQINLFDRHDYDIDLRNYFSVHMIPLVIRIKYDIQMHNPLLPKIKKYHTLAFILATTACQYLVSYYKKNITEDEIGYIALLLDLAIKKRITYSNEKKILIVCDYGRGAQQLLKFQFEQTFTRHVKEIFISDSYHLDNISNQVDHIFSTSPLPPKYNATIVSYDLTDYQINEIRNILRKPKKHFNIPKFNQDLFYTHLNLKSKDEVIQFLTDQFLSKNKISKSIVSQIKAKENLIDSYFANSTAILAPIHTISQETIVSVCILNRPIKWDNNKVQMIITILNEEKFNRYLLRFFDILTQLLLDHHKTNEIIKKKDFFVLIEKYNEIEKLVSK